MSQFDPKEKNKTVKSLYNFLFKERQLLVRSGGGVRHVILTPFKQVAVFTLVVSFVVWTSFVSYMFIYNNNIIENKNRNIKESRNAYSRLLEEVAVYKEHVSDLFSELEKKQKDFANLLTQDAQYDNKSKNTKTQVASLNKDKQKSNEAEADKAADLINETNLVKNEIDFIDSRMDELSSKMSWAIVDQQSLEYELRKVVLQRDIANSESDTLKNKVKDLETLVAEMQEAQMQVIERMAVLADGKIDIIEKSLKSLDSVLEKSGIKIEDLLKSTKELFGQGGPFVPAELPDLRNKQLNNSLEEINDKLDEWSMLYNLQEKIPLGKPVKSIKVTSGFGYRIDPFNGKRARHEGVDLAGHEGENIYARANGKVSRAGPWGWYGNIVEIDHGLGFKTRYAHLSEIDVKKGDYVTTQQVIGKMGSTGRSTGNHLHYEVRIKNNPVNPIDFIKVKRDVFKG
ncbi:MAG: peptidoglycan DD-metalloendopeptidase family protein [Alphaproteobacteria bacterium]